MNGGVAVQLGVDCLAAAALYAIVALAAALAFSGTRVLFIAAGQAGAAGALVAALLVVHAVPVPLAILVGLLVGAAVAAVAENQLVEHVHGRPLYGTALLVAFAVVLQEVLAGFFPAPAYAFPTIGTVIHAGGGVVRLADIVVVGCGLVVAGITAAVLARTTLGVRVRLAARDAVIAERLGIRTVRVRAGTFAVAGALATGVVLLAADRFPLSATTGVVIGLRGLAAAAGNRMRIGPQLAVGALVIAVAEVISGYWLGSGGEAIADAVAAALVLRGAAL